MPYGKGFKPVPDHVPPEHAEQWATVWNQAHEKCMQADGEHDDCEEKAFMAANGVMKQAMAAHEAEQPTPVTEHAEPAPETPAVPVERPDVTVETPAPVGAKKTTAFVESVEILDVSHYLEGTLNRDDRSVKQIIAHAGWSKNKRYYGTDVLRRANSIFEGIRCFEDHPTPQQLKDGETRKKRNISGWIDGVYFSENSQELIGTRHFTSNDAGKDSFALVCDIIERNAPSNLVGGSINAVGNATWGKVGDVEGHIVENITSAYSVDDVAFPAAGGRFERLIAGGDDLLAAVLAAMTYEEFIAVRPEFTARAKKEWQVVRQTETVAAALKERQEAQSALLNEQTRTSQLSEQVTNQEKELDRLRADNARKDMLITLEKALREVRLDADRETLLREQLEQQAPEDWPETIRRVQRLSTSVPVPVHGAPRTEAPAVPIAESFSPLPREDENYADWKQRMAQYRGKEH